MDVLNSGKGSGKNDVQVNNLMSIKNVIRCESNPTTEYVISAIKTAKSLYQKANDPNDPWYSSEGILRWVSPKDSGYYELVDKDFHTRVEGTRELYRLRAAVGIDKHPLIRAVEIISGSCMQPDRNLGVELYTHDADYGKDSQGVKLKFADAKGIQRRLSVVGYDAAISDNWMGGTSLTIAKDGQKVGIISGTFLPTKSLMTRRDVSKIELSHVHITLHPDHAEALIPILFA